ncbi:MAG TPA: protein tyrosine phosphatase, partial [Amnibacterium sp.]|nr:protein tyrosine phosphatase [Amnibacterium sp.]
MSLFTTLVGGKLLIGALAVGSVAVGGTAAAAATGELPTALQQQAHSVFGAPAPKVEATTDAESDAPETDSPASTDTASSASTDTESADPSGTQSSDPAT